MQKNYKVAVVGATGVVGRTALKVLEEKNFPNVSYILFSSEKSAGKKVTFLGKEYIVYQLKESSFELGFDYAIFCAGGETSKNFAPIAVANGCTVIDNSSFYRMNDQVPLVVPEVNPEDIFENKGIIANPNCSTIQAVVPLKPWMTNILLKELFIQLIKLVLVLVDMELKILKKKMMKII